MLGVSKSPVQEKKGLGFEDDRRRRIWGGVAAA
jgi:hypothetical protein